MTFLDEADEERLLKSFANTAEVDWATNRASIYGSLAGEHDAPNAQVDGVVREIESYLSLRKARLRCQLACDLMELVSELPPVETGLVYCARKMTATEEAFLKDLCTDLIVEHL